MENYLSPRDIKPSGHDVRKIKKIIFYTIGFVVFLYLFYFFLLSAPRDFKLGEVARIESRMSLRDISSLLKEENIIRSRVAFESFVIFFGGEKHIISADYSFESKLPVWQVALRIVGGGHRTPPVSVTIPEGFDINKISDAFTPKLVRFNKSQFLLKTQDLEGYLFPDTYFFLSDANELDVIKSMNGNFEKKITPLLPKIASSGKTEKEIIIMASIIEGEARGDQDRGIISGILWKRIKIGMPLQVDSAPETYKTKGFPQSPITNPGLKAIMAAFNPQSSSYLYYLHDKKGNVHYAENFKEHQANIKKYLK